jgi:hypothetical protein
MLRIAGNGEKVDQKIVQQFFPPPRHVRWKFFRWCQWGLRVGSQMSYFNVICVIRHNMTFYVIRRI